MAITEFAREYHEKMFPDYKSDCVMISGSPATIPSIATSPAPSSQTEGTDKISEIPKYK